MALATTKTPDNKNYGKLIQRRFSRTLERVKSSLGKSDKTADEEYDKLAVVFRDQQALANRLHKSLKAYMFQTNVMTEVTQDLYQAMRDAYEMEWDGGKTFREKAEKIPVIHNSHFDTVHERVMTKMNNYSLKFTPVKSRMAKRSRKLTDYDAARRRARSLEGAKKRNEIKIAQSRDQLAASRNVYEALNQDLLRELPRLYDSRVLSLCALFETFLTAEDDFSAKLSTVNKEMAEIVFKMREKAEAEWNLNKNSTERQMNNYSTLQSHQLRRFSDDEFNHSSRYDETGSGSDFSTNEIPKYSEDYNETLGGAVMEENEEKEEARVAMASWSQNDDITSSIKPGTAEKSTQHPSRPAVGPSINRTPVNVVADVHKGGKSENPPAYVTTTVTSSTTVSSSLDSDSPAMVQQQMIQKKQKQQEDDMLKKKREEDLVKRKEEFLNGNGELKKKNEEELLKVQMLKQKQEEEYWKQQFEQQQARQKQLQQREEQAMQQHKQRQLEKQQLSSNAAADSSATAASDKSTTDSNSTAAVNNPITVSPATTNQFVQTSIDKADEAVSLSTAGPQISSSGLGSNEESVQKDLEPNVSIVTGSLAEQKLEDRDSQKTESIYENINSTTSVEEKLSAILEESPKSDEDVILYEVVAIKEYHGEDSEELNLEPGHLIKVLQWNKSEPLDNGWLFGINTSTKVRGIFQANFTEKIET